MASIGMDARIAVFRDRFDRLKKEIALKARSNGYSHEIRIVGVTKGRSDEEAMALFEAGVDHLAENRWEFLSGRVELFQSGRFPLWHFIGALQRRSLRQNYRPVFSVDTVDRPSVLPVLARLAEQGKTRQNILVELDLTGLPGRSGVREERLDSLLEECTRWPELVVRGFLVMGPPPEDRTLSRQVFRRGRALFERFFSGNDHVLSMGMSEDYPEAVAEGSTEVRIGRYFFEEERK
ncbi:YggS family pyridoxal phosphate enzyme [Leptospirillum ferriphilum]|nr:YggS family pyridoxal phosphate enzyme [Leptospirillum ferriphilum]